MPNFLDKGRLLIRERLGSDCAITLAAERVGQFATRTCTITTAVIGKTAFVSNATMGPRVEHGERDYLIPPADYLLGAGGTATEPEEGDRFRSTEEGLTYVFECKPQPGEPAARWSDGGKTMYRVHCKRVTDQTGQP